MHGPQVEHTRALCREWVESGPGHAISACVARRGVIVLHEAFGRLRPEVSAPALETRSIYPLSSATKPITATLAMQLVEEGRLGLNRPVREYLPEVTSEGSDAMLVHHLLTHTAGYVFHTDPVMVKHMLEKAAGGFEAPPCPEAQHPILHQMNALFYDAPLAFAPGQEMVYSNINYEFLGEIIRRVSGRSLEDLARERIFDPLGMRDTWYVVPEAEDARVVKRPSEWAMETPGNPFWQGLNSRQVQETPFAGAGVFSTPLDIAAFAQCFLDAGRHGDTRILSPATVRAMTRNQIPGIPARLLDFHAPEASWGYGWTVESPVKWEGYNGSLWSLGSFSHSGAGGIVFWVDPAQEVVGVYFEVAKLWEEAGTMGMEWKADLFQNAIMAAIED